MEEIFKFLLGGPIELMGWAIAVGLIVQLIRTNNRSVELANENTKTMLAFAEKQTDRHEAFQRVAELLKGLATVVDERLPKHGRRK
jgi:hypothetical protein